AKASAFGDSPGRLSFYSLHESRKKVSHVTLLFVMLKNYSRRFAWSRSFQFLGITLFSAYDLQVDRQAEKGCILNSRILWFFSEAAMLTGRADAAACARHAYQWFEDHCFDRENGGVYWSCDALGRPLDTTKHTYNQAFAIYALSAYYRLTGQQAALDRALELFRLIESRCTDAEGYLEAFTVDWKPESNEKLSENGVMADKTMNTLLHVF